MRVKMPAMVQFVILDEKSCDMLIYFNRPTQFRYLKYTELFKSYIVEKISQVENEDQDDLSGYFLINIPGLETLYLQSLNENVLNTFNANGVPNHILKLKVNDIFDVTRSLKTSEIATNYRIIKPEPLNYFNRIVLIPRVRFNFNLSYGESYQMMQCQFPLRLAYCITYIKSQSQPLVDVYCNLSHMVTYMQQCLE